MEENEIRRILTPFCEGVELSDAQVEQIDAYLALLLVWNAKLSLSSVREPAAILQRHFGESIFAALHLAKEGESLRLMDIGSGAGFPGLPFKIARPQVEVTLVEAKAKRATFLREVIRRLQLKPVSVHEGRAEALQADADLVTLRAVEKFADILPVAWSKVAVGGRLALLIGEAQVAATSEILQVECLDVAKLPNSEGRVVASWRK